MSTPEALGNYVINQVKNARDNRSEDRADKDVKRADDSFAETIKQHGIENKNADRTFDASRDDKKFEHGIQNQQITLERQKLSDAHDDRVLAINSKLKEDAFKNNTSNRENLQAAVADFDKSFARDAMGNLSGTAINSQLYAQSVDHMGDIIKQGGSIGDAVNSARQVYDTASKLADSGDKNPWDNAKNNLTTPKKPGAASGDYSHLWGK